MEIGTALVRSMGGVPFPCHITEYLQTTIFRIPTYKVEKGHIAPYTLKKTNDFKASVVTNPVSYLLNDSFSNQRFVDENFGEALRQCCKQEEDKPEKTIFVVVQLRENMGTFPVVDGQCARFLFENVERYMVFDCSGARAPLPKDQTENISMVLSAVKAELEITDALEKAFNANCFDTLENKCVIRGEVSGSAGVQLVSPITSHDLSARAHAIKNLVTRLESEIEQPSQNRPQHFGERLGELTRALQLEPTIDDTFLSPITSHDLSARAHAIKNLVTRLESEIEQPSQNRPQHFGERLGELTRALQLEPTIDDTFLRLWYLQLWERTQELGDAFRPKLQLLNDQDLKNEKQHRNDIAHYKVDALDWEMLRSLQKKVFGILKQRL